MNLDPAWIGAGATLCGSILLRIIEKLLNKDKEESDDATQIRSELRSEIESQRREISELEEQVDKWREEYFSLKENYLHLKTELQIAVERLNSVAGDET